ncbi:MAG: efflux RND transporter periplasmic adaptor subunit [Planctomycetota bacterium]
MAVSRPTFHEAWYRVANLCPRLLSSVQVYKQYFRGQMWYVLENPSNNKFSRVSEESYQFIALLDGNRTVEDVWRLCDERLGDLAPTQGEIIQLLGQLYCSNILYVGLALDAESLFNRYRMRVRRQIQGFLTNLLFVRIPLIDPNNFLDRWLSVFGRVFTLPGFLLWLAVLFTGLYFVIGNLGELIYQSSDVLAPDNLILLYVCMVVIKISHEFGHAFACKRFGRINGSGGEVHVMGVMFLVFVPLPYVDASSAWAFRRKRYRAIVGMSGVMVELFAAAVAAIIWANTSTGIIHIIAYNIIFIASISTLIFNGNPLLRFDAYYVLSDLIEIPNLGNRSRSHLYCLVKKFCWGLKNTRSPAHTIGESIWFTFYGLASTAYRIFICVRILLFLNNRLPEELFLLVPIFAGTAIITWVIFPIGRFIRYLATSSELSRDRTRAIGTTLGTLASIILFIGIIKMPDYCRVEGVVEPVDLSVIYMETDGFINGYLPSEKAIDPNGPPLIEAFNERLKAEQKALIAERTALQTKQRIAEMREIAVAQMLGEQILALEERIERIKYELASLKLHAPRRGVWVSPDIEKAGGMYLSRGERIGYVADLDDVLIRATAKQKLAAQLIEQARKEVEIRVKGCPSGLVKGQLEEIFPAGLEVLPSQALGYAVGGSMPTTPRDPYGIRAAELFFELRIRPDKDSSVRLLAGQRVIVRLQTRSKPLAVQWWLSLRQLFQRRFRI